MLNTEIKTTYCYVDEYFLMLRLNLFGGGDNGKGDCIGRTADAYRAYKDKRFIDGIKKCYVEEDGRIQAYRHPSYISPVNTMSRDHVAYTLYIMKYANETDFLKMLSKGLTWKISDKAMFTPDLWLYMKAVSNGGLYNALYWITSLYIPMLVLYRRLVYWYCDIQPELAQDDWMFDKSKIKPLPSSKFKMFLIKRLRILPMYTIYQLSFMWDVLPNSLIKRAMKRVLLSAVDKRNYVARLMLGDTYYTKEEIYSYQSMTGDRFTTHLNALTDRYVEVINDKYNTLDVDLLRSIYRCYHPETQSASTENG